MKKVVVRFFNGNTLIRTEIFSNELEADLYLANETVDYEFCTIEIGNVDVI